MTPHKLSRLAFRPDSFVCVMNLPFRNEIAVDLFSASTSTPFVIFHVVSGPLLRRTFKELI